MKEFIDYTKKNLLECGKFLNKIVIAKGSSYIQLKNDICEVVNNIKEFDEFRGLYAPNIKKYEHVYKSVKDESNKIINKYITGSIYDILTNHSFSLSKKYMTSKELIDTLVIEFNKLKENKKKIILSYLVHLDVNDDDEIDEIALNYCTYTDVSLNELLHNLKKSRIHNKLIHKICDKIGYDFCTDKELLGHMSRYTAENMPAYKQPYNFKKIDTKRNQKING